SVLGLADLGWEVLDANVEVTTLVFGKNNGAPSFFFDERLLQHKAQALATQVNQLKENLSENTYLMNPTSIAVLPNCAFAYDMPLSVVSAFEKHKSLVQQGHRALQGHNLSMEQFALLSWEVSPNVIADRTFIRMYKGGDYCKFYQPSYEVALWKGNGQHLRGHSGTRWGNEAFQEKPGIGYGKRGDFLDAHILPAGQIFTVEGLAVFPKTLDQTWGILALLNSSACSYILNFYSGQHKMSGYLAQLPVPLVSKLFIDCGEIAKNVYTLKHLLDQCNELSAEFVSWTLLQKVDATIKSTAKVLMLKTDDVRARFRSMDEMVSEVFDLCHTKLLEDAFVATQPPDAASIAFDTSDDILSRQQIADGLMHYVLGCTFGRWDIRFATGERQAPELPDPFAALPACPPGMLQNSEGLPAEPKDVPSDYPLRISWPGILVDDENHNEDIITHVREALEVIWKDRAEAIEQEACVLLGVKSLRDYFRRPTGLFADHLKRYSKSRRQAPIYWPLSTKNGSYTLWIYYQRLTDQTLHTALADFVDPKIKAVRIEINSLKESGKKQARLEELRDLEKELLDFHDEIERIIKLPWKPNLNDGVIITASPLWKLFRLPKWQKDLKACWDKFEKGEYDWAHLAYSIWPERVEEVCKKDRSIAIAHNLEHLYEPAASKEKTKRRKKGN
nr:hypothetical protein [Paludibacter sp.]